MRGDRLQWREWFSQLVCCCWEVGGGETKGLRGYGALPNPPESDSWQLLFVLYQCILEGLVVLYASPHPSLRDQVIREHRFCTAISIFYSIMSMVKMELENQSK